MPNVHDSGYKLLFSNKNLFRELIQTFVDEPWVKDLDFSECEKLPKSFVSKHYSETESDLIYNLKLKGKDFYIYILLEFQSTVDEFMALRFLNYITNFYMDYKLSNPKAKKLKPVFPLLLYNGNERWTAPYNISDLISGNELLGRFALKFEYFRILENEYSKDELLEIRNFISTLFLAETHYDVELIRRELNALFKGEKDKALASTLFNWFAQLFANEKISKNDFAIFENVYKNSRKADSMLITSIKEEKKKVFQEGRQDKALEIAKNMLLDEESFDKISTYTGLTVDEIIELQKSIKN